MVRIIDRTGGKGSRFSLLNGLTVCYKLRGEMRDNRSLLVFTDLASRTDREEGRSMIRIVDRTRDGKLRSVLMEDQEVEYRPQRRGGEDTHKPLLVFC